MDTWKVSEISLINLNGFKMMVWSVEYCGWYKCVTKLLTDSLIDWLKEWSNDWLTN